MEIKKTAKMEIKKTAKMEIKKTAKSEQEAVLMCHEIRLDAVRCQDGVSVVSSNSEQASFDIFKLNGHVETVTIQIQPEPEYKEGVLGLAWADDLSDKKIVWYFEFKGAKHRCWYKKDHYGEYSDWANYRNFTPLPNYERALEIACVDMGIVERKTAEDVMQHYLTLANKEQIK
jgi:hypothetical protein